MSFLRAPTFAGALGRALLVASALLSATGAQAQIKAGMPIIMPGPSGKALVRFEITVPSTVRAEPTTGRAYVVLSSTNTPEPRLQVNRVGAPLFGRDIEQLKAGQAAVVDGSDLGTPVADMADIPAGDYWVQGVINIYSEFRRSDGKVLWMHDDQWEGQKWDVSPGNIYSTSQKIHIDPKTRQVVKLVADQVIPPIVVAADNDYVQRFKFQSPSLTKFWGRPIFLGAVVLLPRDYKTATISYPVEYIQGHFGLGAPHNFDRDTAFHRAWTSDNFPRMISVTFQHPTPYFDDSYAVNTPNMGPYGDAIMNELITEFERRYRVIKEPWARWLSGGSTGGWESLALQIYHPDFFGGTWSGCPDPVTFTDVEGINVYKDENAFYKQITEWQRTPTINSREVNGEVRQTSQQRNWMELVNGTKGRSGGQLDIWSATFGNVGPDGYFKPLFDKRTGVIDKTVPEEWRKNSDLLYYLQQNWSMVGPKLVDKLHIYVGDMDSFHLDRATRVLEAWMKTTQNPHYEGFFMYGDQKPHCWSGPVTPAERLREMAQFGLRKKPDGTTTPWWTY